MIEQTIWLVSLNGEALEVFLTSEKAYTWAENKYGSKQDGICVEGITIEEFYLLSK